MPQFEDAAREIKAVLEDLAAERLRLEGQGGAPTPSELTRLNELRPAMDVLQRTLDLLPKLTKVAEAARLLKTVRAALAGAGDDEDVNTANAGRELILLRGLAEANLSPGPERAALSATIVIDPGHGGPSNPVKVDGSSWNNSRSPSGVLEKTMTLQLGLLLRDALVALNDANTALKVVMTRDTDVNLGLTARAQVARNNQADRFLSIHFNGFDGQARGVETLIRPVADGNVNHGEDRTFATRVQKAVFDTLKSFDAGTKDRGVKDQKLAVLSDPSLGNTPANHPCRACLVEIEFIDVPQVDQLLNTNANAATVRSAVAKAIAAAILDDLRNG